MIALNDFKFLEVKPSALQHELITNKKNKSTVKFSSLAFFQLLVSSKSFDQICYLYKLKILLSRIILSDIVFHPQVTCSWRSQPNKTTLYLLAIKVVCFRARRFSFRQFSVDCWWMHSSACQTILFWQSCLTL